MPSLDHALAALAAHPGVRHVLVLGRDGLLIAHHGDPSLDAETVSAMIPGLASAAGALGQASGAGEAETIAVRLGSGVALASVLSDEVLMAVLLDAGVGFAPLLRDLAARRDELAALV
ncbi:roadblock/LC7 domain-containing protein [Longimicrobium terrae]|uniref:Putative regulator of Ras-like GTPase activity (Roadblock/LC7/MglB family) n=1 Tax=Longimicrobium terrae TaxID=1639882 RepID=A0A841GRC1_9BACT|nr:roadblock/LC7 domain-containing protein [Longimicrobium terrae]MBB4635748.1 putative regulator of Ras-like GTPase activity (Roadblock/LC7/MglB family) [Longimicrobium terrae]MBB6070142.1 putative regulator of Ras-like GTPase activity (Roadblock/LC7/MglB family) [Longimicrobium terrae]NNC33043.1 roadblock/LC7 domain-containing protein [Longimicrobium terrae]